MVARQVLVGHNSFITSVLSIGITLGTMFFQELTGKLLDRFTEPIIGFLGYEVYESANIISLVFFVASQLCFLILIPMCLIYRKYVGLIVIKK